MASSLDFPHPRDLKYFQEIALTLNLSRAAERLGVGQPSLSLSLQRLEESLQVALFTRTTKGLKLTPSGDRLLQHSNQLVDNWNLLVSETRKSQTELQGRFRLGCHPSVALYTLNPFVRDFYARHGGIEFQLVHDRSRIICEQVISGKIDFGFVINPVQHPELVIRKLATDEVAFWSLTGKVSDVLIYTPDGVQSQTLLKKAKLKFSRTLSSDNLEVISLIARSGVGTAILPTRVAKTLAPELQRIPNLPVYTDQVTFCYRHDLPKSAATAAILAEVRLLKI